MWHAGRENKCVKTCVEKPEGKRPLGRPGSGWEDNIRLYLRGRG